jgi:hypothetical protein
MLPEKGPFLLQNLNKLRIYAVAFTFVCGSAAVSSSFLEKKRGDAAAARCALLLKK